MQGGTEPDAEGVTPRLVRWLVSEREEREALAAGVKRKGRGRKRKADDEAKMAQRIEIAMECFEIYNEMVFDLLVRERPVSRVLTLLEKALRGLKCGTALQVCNGVLLLRGTWR